MSGSYVLHRPQRRPSHRVVYNRSSPDSEYRWFCVWAANERRSKVWFVDLATVVPSVRQIAGVKATTQHVGMGMSVVSRSGHYEHRAQCPAHVSKWTIATRHQSPTVEAPRKRTISRKHTPVGQVMSAVWGGAVKLLHGIACEPSDASGSGMSTFQPST